MPGYNLAIIPVSYTHLIPLEKEFQRKLQEPGIAGGCDLTERRWTVGKTAVGVRVIGVVEHIENLRAKLQVPGFTEDDLLMNREVEIDKPWAATDGALRAVVEAAEWRNCSAIWRCSGGKIIGIEPVACLLYTSRCV